MGSAQRLRCKSAAHPCLGGCRAPSHALQSPHSAALPCAHARPGPRSAQRTRGGDATVAPRPPGAERGLGNVPWPAGAQPGPCQAPAAQVRGSTCHLTEGTRVPGSSPPSRPSCRSLPPRRRHSGPCRQPSLGPVVSCPSPLPVYSPLKAGSPWALLPVVMCVQT